MSFTNRIKAAWKGLRGELLVPSAHAHLSLLELRLDPTARFNVFRIFKSRLMLEDTWKYSGNDIRKAVTAMDTYVGAPYWLGTVYLFDGEQIIDTVTR